MRKFLLAALAALLITPAWAGSEVIGPPDGVWQTLSPTERLVVGQRTVGKVMFASKSASVNEFAFGFRSHWVTICVDAQNSTTAYLRLTPTNSATNADYFVNGATNILGGRAIPIATTGSSSYGRCFSQPWQVTGVTVLNNDSGVTLDVWAH